MDDQNTKKADSLDLSTIGKSATSKITFRLENERSEPNTFMRGTSKISLFNDGRDVNLSAQSELINKFADALERRSKDLEQSVTLSHPLTTTSDTFDDLTDEQEKTRGRRSTRTVPLVIVYLYRIS